METIFSSFLLFKQIEWVDSMIDWSNIKSVPDVIRCCVRRPQKAIGLDNSFKFNQPQKPCHQVEL